MNLLDLFSGIGAFSYGLERAGFKTVAFCEIEPFCRQVLAKHWPTVPCYDDVRELDATRLRADGIDRISAICGGFPCQDISLAGKGAGLDGERSGLWREFSRLIGELRPVYVIVENVGALRARGLAEVLADLASFGYDAQWHVIPAAAVGAPHLRERVWIIGTAANANDGHGVEQNQAVCAGRDAADLGSFEHAYSNDERPGWAWRSGAATSREQQPIRALPGAAADTAGPGFPQCSGLQRRLARALATASTPWQWTAEPAFRRVDDGAAKRLDRAALKALGNSVVPQIPEIIGRALLETT